MCTFLASVEPESFAAGRFLMRLDEIVDTILDDEAPKQWK